MRVSWAVAIAALVFIAAPIIIYSNNYSDLVGVEPINMARISLLAFLSASIALFILSKFVSLFIPAKLRYLVGGFLLFFVLLTSMILPLVGTSGQVEVREIPVNGLNLLLAASGAIVLAGLFLTPLRGALIAGSVALVAASVGGSLWNVVAAPPVKKDLKDISVLSSSRNISCWGSTVFQGRWWARCLMRTLRCGSPWMDSCFSRMW